jgi:GTP 3',8-cyclase
VMDRCNFRCPYCMPRETYHERYRFLGSHERLSFDEIVRLARLFVQLGVRKLRLTGGEPLLRANLPDLVGDLTTIADVEDVALTTNGMLLARYAGELRAAGLKRVTVSLDSLDPTVFARMSGGLGGVAEVLAGIEQAQRAELTPIKINAVVQRGVNEHTVLELVERFRGTGVIVRFIEYMDVGNRNHWRSELVVPSQELAARIGARWPLVALTPGYHGEVAERYAFADGQGEVGFISSVSQPFCGDCTRVRLSSDGIMYTCLFATHGTSLRDALRGGASDDTLLELIRDVWDKRSDRYSELRASLRSAPEQRKVEMFYIGG